MRREYLFINQSVGPLFLELVEDVCRQIDQLHLITGTKLKNSIPRLRLIKTPPYNRSNMLRRAWSWLLFCAIATKEIMRIRRDVPIIVVSNPPMIPWLILGINYIRKQQYIVLVYDIYPDLLVGLRVLSPTHPVTRLWRFLNRIAYKHAKYVITLGPFMASSLGQYLDFRDKDQRLKIIPTWVDSTRFVPLDKESNPFAIKHGQQFKFTVMYSGNIGFSHDIQILIDVAERLRNDRTIHFLVIGDGPHKSLSIERASSAKLDNITFLPFQDEEMLPLSLATADVSVISIGKGVERLMMPSKTYYAMAVGSALLGLSVEPNDLGDVIARYDCGVNVEPDDVDGVVAALKRFESDRVYLDKCRKNARIAAVRYFTRTRIIDQFCKLIDIV